MKAVVFTLWAPDISNSRPQTLTTSSYMLKHIYLHSTSPPPTFKIRETIYPSIQKSWFKDASWAVSGHCRRLRAVITTMQLLVYVSYPMRWRSSAKMIMNWEIRCHLTTCLRSYKSATISPFEHTRGCLCTR